MVRVDISHTLVPPQDAVLCGDVMASLMLAPSTFATLSFPGVEKPKKPEGAAWAVDARGRGGVYHGSPLTVNEVLSHTLGSFLSSSQFSSLGLRKFISSGRVACGPTLAGLG